MAASFEGVSRSVRLVAGLTSICLSVAACGGEEPTDYSDQNRDAFLAACVDAETDGLYEQRVCQCAYDEAAATIPFERFREINDTLADADPPVLPEDLLEVIAVCIIEEGDL